MKTLSRAVAVIGMAFILAAAETRADTIVFYSFTSNTTFAVNTAAWTNASLTADIGSSISSFTNFNAGGTALTFLSSVAGNPNNHGFPASNSISQNRWDGDASYFQFTLDSTGYSGITLSWAQNRSSTGPNQWTLRYSTNGGGSFTDFATFALVANSAVTQDLSSVTAIDNNPNVVFRLVGVGATAATGTAKIDNFAIEATLIPEPSTVLLVGVGLAGLVAMRRRRK